MPNSPSHWPRDRALAVMHEAYARQLEPRLLSCFTQMLGRWPAGVLLRLDSGQLAVVSRPNPDDADHPFVYLLISDDGERRLDPKEISLAERGADGAFLFSPTEALDPLAEDLDVASLLREVDESHVQAA